MKKAFYKFLVLAIAVSAVITFYGCDNKSNSSSQASTDAKKGSSATADVPDETQEPVIKRLHTFDTESKDLFSGAWHITDGEGSQYVNFVYMFDGNGTANLFTGNSGFIEKYSFGETEDNQKTITAQLMFGVNGTYTYKFDKDNNNVVITNVDSKSTTTLSKLQSFDYIPIPKTNTTVDKSLFGAWKSDDGEYFYFDKNGIMYQNMYNKTFTYSTYEAKDGKIVSEFSNGEEDSVENFTYSVSNDVLKLNNYEYHKIKDSELK